MLLNYRLVQMNKKVRGVTGGALAQGDGHAALGDWGHAMHRHVSAVALQHQARPCRKQRHPLLSDMGVHTLKRNLS